jgi:hypothetical protein
MKLGHEGQRETKPFVASAILLWRLQFTGRLTGFVRLRRINCDRHRDNVVAPLALEVPQIEALGPQHDPSQIHAVAAFRIARSLDGHEWRTGRMGM